jgi:RNA polymerase sigma-70 factor (ECF subfamily)
LGSAGTSLGSFWARSRPARSRERPGRPDLSRLHSPTTGPGAPAGDPELQSLRDGDERAWERVVAKHGGRLLGIARRILRDDQAAEDCLQDTFVQAYLHIGSFEERSALPTWLHRIAVNAALVRLRSRRRRAEEPIEDLLPVFDEYGHREPLGKPSFDPEEAAGRGQEIARVREAVDQLPDSYRLVLLLRDFEELSTEETAELLETTTGAVKLRLHRARAALKTLLERPYAPSRRRRPGPFTRRVRGIAMRLPAQMTCQEFESFLMDFLDGSLTHRQRFVFEVHLRTCSDCRAYLDRYRRTVALGQKARAEEKTPLPPDMPPRLVQAIEQARSR